MFKQLQKLLLWIKNWFKETINRFIPHRLQIYSIERITPGKRHAWLNTNVGLIRKPLGTFVIKE